MCTKEKPRDIKEFIGRVVKHFEGNRYIVLNIVQHKETGEELVIYRELYGLYKGYAEPSSSFLDKIDKSQYPFAEQIYRFELEVQ